MNSLRAVFVHELRRSLTAARIVWWLVMAAFPVVITLCLLAIPDFLRGATSSQRDSVWSGLLYVLIPCVSCGLSVLLLAAPAIATELEQRSWVYMATRPRGIVWLLAGKYLVAVVWGATAGLASVLVALPLCSAVSKMQIGLGITALTMLSAISYSAVFLLVGAVNHKRSMLLCVAYTGLIEVVLGFVPAIVNRLTVQYRLRSLLLAWMPLDPEVRVNSSAFGYISENSWWPVDCGWLLMQAAVFLAAAVFVAHRREFTAAAEGDV
jgi:hypothetical protein